MNTSEQQGVMPENVRKCPILAKRTEESETGLSEPQRKAIGLMLLGKSLGAVSQAVSIDPKTLYRWRQDELFREELERRRRELWEGAAERLRALVHPALDVLEEQLCDSYDRSRVRAAGMLLRLADLRKCVPPGEEE